MSHDPRNPDEADLPDEFVESLESYIVGAISVEQIRRRIGSLLGDNQDWGPGMLMAIDKAFHNGYLNGTAHRTLMTEIDLGTSEDEPTEWSEETQAALDDEPDSTPAEPPSFEVTTFVDAAAATSAEAPKDLPEALPNERVADRTPDARDTAADRQPESIPPVLTNAVEGEPQSFTVVAGPDTKTVGPGMLLRQRYLLREKIGTGSMGDVYKALDREKEAAGSPEPWVAVKIVSQEFSRIPNALEALKQEAAYGQALVHPNVIRVFDFDWDGDHYFMTMEWLEGQSLVDVLNGRRFQPLPLHQASTIIQSLCHGLGHAHAQGIVHADIKPGNVFITQAGHIKLLDFGIARVTADMPVAFDATGIGAHTPAYSSCEVLEGEAPEAVDDVYSLGCVAYRLLAGRRAFGGATALEAEAKKIELQRIPNLHDSQWSALKGALTFRRVHRTPDVAMFLAEFTSQATVDMTRPMPSPPAAATPPPREGFQGLPLKLGLPALAATLGAIAVVLWWPDWLDVERIASTLPTDSELLAESASVDTTVPIPAAPVDTETDDAPETSVDPGPVVDNDDPPGISIGEPPLSNEAAAASPVRPPVEVSTAEFALATNADVNVPAESSATEIAPTATPEDAAEAPPAAQSRQHEQTEQFEALLDSANQRMDAGQLVEPAADSARDLVTQLETIAPDSPELQQTRLRLANLMLLEAMVAITDQRFSIAEEWIAQTRALGVPDTMIARYETELQEARNVKSTRDSETLGAIFASATPAAILANPDISYDTGALDSANASGSATSPQNTALAMVLPGAPAAPAGASASPADTGPQPEPEPEPTPLSELEFRRFVEPQRPTGSTGKNTDGWVEVRFRVDEKGKTGDVEVVASEPAGVFDQAALSAVRRWRFRPYQVDGKVAATESGVRLKFESD